MQKASYDSRARTRVAPNFYRRTTKAGEVVYEVLLRDSDGKQRRRLLAASSERAAIREARKILAQRDRGERIVAAKVTVREFAEAEWLPLLDSLAEARRRSQRGVDLDRDSWRLYVEPVLGDSVLGAVTGAEVAALLRGLRALPIRGDLGKRTARRERALPSRPRPAGCNALACR